MRFNSNSVIFKTDTIQYNKGMDIPEGLMYTKISIDVWDDAIKEFNKELDSRDQVSETIDNIQVDVLKMIREGGSFYLSIITNRKNITDVFDRLTITFNGKLIKDKNTKNIKRIVINDLLYGPSIYVTKSILKKELTF